MASLGRPLCLVPNMPRLGWPGKRGQNFASSVGLMGPIMATSQRLEGWCVRGILQGIRARFISEPLQGSHQLHRLDFEAVGANLYSGLFPISPRPEMCQLKAPVGSGKIRLDSHGGADQLVVLDDLICSIRLVLYESFLDFFQAFSRPWCRLGIVFQRYIHLRSDIWE